MRRVPECTVVKREYHATYNTSKAYIYDDRLITLWQLLSNESIALLTAVRARRKAVWISVSVMERRPVKLVRTIRFPGPLQQVLSLGVRQKELDEGSAEDPVGAALDDVEVMGDRRVFLSGLA